MQRSESLTSDEVQALRDLIRGSERAGFVTLDCPQYLTGAHHRVVNALKTALRVITSGRTEL